MTIGESRREKIRTLFEKAVYGPLFGEEEILNTHPLNLYAAGVICPSCLTNETNNNVDIDDTDMSAESYNEDNNDLIRLVDNDDNYSNKRKNINDIDDDPPKQNRYSVNISSFGTTFVCNNILKNIIINISYSRYHYQEDPPFEIFRDKEGNEREKKLYKYISKRYTWSNSCKLIPDQKPIIIEDEKLLLKLSFKIRNNNGKKIVSLFVSNESPMFGKTLSLRSKKILSSLVFRPELSIKIPKNEIQIDDPARTVKIDFSDDRVNEMLYRNYKRIGQGHNCAVYYDHEKESLYTKFLPEQKTKWLNTSFDTNPTYHLFKEIFSVDYLLHKKNKENIINKFRIFLSSFYDWIKLENPPETFINEFNNNQKNCKNIKRRIEEGINYLVKNDLIYEVWLDTHQAMKMQFEKSNPEKELQYRPFQLAFLLMMIDSITNEKSLDRNIADLLWVPTGGGKTEAYLAVAAFTILYRRRMYGDKGKGLAVISRYTLRLLTAQQFERTAKLICALELIRRENEQDYGRDEILLGLFIGGTSSPNLIDNALDKIKRYNTKSFPIQRCPWCGSALKNINNSVTEPNNSFHKKDPNKFYIKCIDQQCDFFKIKKLPIQFVDQMLEKETPSMIICTVDKFAMMPFQTDKFNNIIMRHRPPDLIIQDELHLIDSALGSIFGLYETTNNVLWETNHKIKIIASTATPKEADTQLKLLFNRKTSIFPKPLSSIDDTFFTQLQDESYGRSYLGFMPSCTSAKNGMIVALAALLAASAISNGSIYEDNYRNVYFFDTHDDPYKMITCYFNSIRELGGTSASIDDEVTKRLPMILKYLYYSSKYKEDNTFNYNEKLKNKKENEKPYFQRNKYSKLNHFELTGRISNSDLTYHLSRLEAKDKKLPDILMSTNMISVGIDIKDLNIMIVNGQPKKIAEYIQASSRAGRQKDNPGLVLMLYNPVKLRDISFYEYFYSYHQTFYRYIEPVSVTPFSSQCLDRGLLAQMVSLMRNKDKGPKNHITLFNFSFTDLWEKIEERINNEDEKKKTEIKNNYNKMIERELQTIDVIYKKGDPMYAFFENLYNDQSDKHYLIKFINEKIKDGHLMDTKGCMTSFRDVSGECEIEVIDINYED